MRIVKKGIADLLEVEDLNDPDLQSQRYDTCKACPSYRERVDKCGECGCYMEFKTGMLYNRNAKKLGRIEKTHCPLGKWDDIDTANFYRKIDGLPIL